MMRLYKQQHQFYLTKENLPCERKHLKEKRKVFRKLPMRALDYRGHIDVMRAMKRVTGRQL